MRIRLIYCLAFVITLIFSSAALAGDFASLNVIGFSKDGHYFAFEEYGSQDGSGFPYSNIYFIDTTKNAFATQQVKVLIQKESAAESTARTRAAALAAKQLARLGIIRGNTGQLVVSHPMTDQTFDDGSNDKLANLVKFAEQFQSMHREGDFELLLTPVKVKTKACEAYEKESVMLELKLTDNVANTNKFLQKDSTLPASRGCAQSYRIQDVYIYKGLIAVFMNVFTPGFEGPDMRFIAAAGKLK